MKLTGYIIEGYYWVYDIPFRWRYREVLRLLRLARRNRELAGREPGKMER